MHGSWRSQRYFEFGSWISRAVVLGGVLGWLAAGRLAAQSTAAVPVELGSWDREVVGQIDTMVEQVWRELDLAPSDEASQAKWVRRVYLDLIGRIPTGDELQGFVRDRGRGKHERLVLRLLYEPEYQEEYVWYWSTMWANVLVGRRGPGQADRGVSREGLEAYLSEAIAANRPYDRMVYELLTAEGASAPGRADFNGAVNFLAGKLNDRATQATADTARIFLGMQVQCTQCHNHPFNDWKQDQFWGLNSFFRQAVALRRFGGDSGDVAWVELADQDFPGENRRNRTPERAEVYYELRNSDLRAAYPRFIDGTEIDPSGFVQDVHRRRELAELVVASDEMPRALVNRLWAHFLKYGFTDPVDDMGPHNPPSHPQLLEYLADAFRSSGYDLRRLMAWIALSRPYRLSSRPSGSNVQDDPSLGRPPRFSRFYLRQMRPEELFDSLQVVAAPPGRLPSRSENQEARRAWLRQFVLELGTDEGGQATTFDGTIPQMLTMFNGEWTERAVRLEGDTLLAVTMHDPGLSNIEKIQRLFRVAVARGPTRGELNLFRTLLAAHKGRADLAIEDLWWALINSNEFILNH